MPAKKTTAPKATTAKATTKTIDVASPKPETEQEKTFAEMKFKSAPSTGVNSAASSKPTEPEAQPENALTTLKPNEWVKILSGEFINRVGLVDKSEDEKVKVNLQGINLDFPVEELEGLAVSANKRSSHQFQKTYRTFHIFTTDSLAGGINGYAINREVNIRLERHYHGIAPEQVGAIMLELVDGVIEERKLDIPPYQPPGARIEKTTSEVNAEIVARNEQEAQAHRDAQTFTFEALSGVQAGYPVFSAILTFNKVRKLIDVNLRKIPPEERYQRVPSASRVKALSNYVIQYPDSYILPSITCTIEGEYEFKPQAARSSLGNLTLKPGTKLHPIDGGHRLNGINAIINQVPKLADEEICVKFAIDRGLKQRR